MQTLLKNFKELANNRFIINIIYLFLIHFINCFFYEMNYENQKHVPLEKNWKMRKGEMQSINLLNCNE